MSSLTWQPGHKRTLQRGDVKSDLECAMWRCKGVVFEPSLLIWHRVVRVCEAGEWLRPRTTVMRQKWLSAKRETRLHATRPS